MWQVDTGNLVVLMKTFNCSEISLTISGTNIKVKNLPSVHILVDFNFRDIDSPDRQQSRFSVESVGGINVDRHHE